MISPDTIAATPRLGRKPRDEEIDVYGLTHPGALRQENQDHFLIGALRKEFAIRQTSLPELGRVPVGTEQIGRASCRERV